MAMTLDTMPDGIIELDSERGQAIGFTSDRFDGYLWKTGRYVTVSFIVSLATGNFRQLAESILAQGFGVKIPTPLGRMQKIVRDAGYVQRDETWEELDERVEMWVKEPA